MTKLVFLNLYPDDTIARYLLSSYTLSAYIHEYYPGISGLDIKILNHSKDSAEEKIVDALLKENADVISYSCYVWNVNLIIEIAGLISARTGTVQIFGGPDITIEKIRSSYSNFKDKAYFVIGEGERKIVDLLKYLDPRVGNSRQPLPNGIARWQDDTLIFAPEKTVISNLDEIPSIYLNQYIEPRLYEYQQAFLETQRGCRFRCKYCVYHKNNNKISYYSLDRVYRELNYLIIEKKIKALRIFDAIFTSDLERAKNIVRYLIGIREQGHPLPWIYWEFTYDSVDEEFVKLAEKLKTRELIRNNEDLVALDRPQHYSDMLNGYTAINCIGIQSFNQGTLKAIGRPRFDHERFKIFMDAVNRHNVVLKVDIILGLPVETMNTYFAGLEYLLQFLEGTDHVLNIHRLQILPGTAMEKEADKYSIDYSQEAPYYTFSTEHMTREGMTESARLSALLFRIVNSPLRSQFYTLKEQNPLPLKFLMMEMWSMLEKIPDVRDTPLFMADLVDDNYWNNKIYRDIPSAAMSDILNEMISR
jgi:radical SAM superfamily enzyme YgiQ (UPF0313 family)